MYVHTRLFLLCLLCQGNGLSIRLRKDAPQVREVLYLLYHLVSFGCSGLQSMLTLAHGPLWSESPAWTEWAQLEICLTHMSQSHACSGNNNN